MGFTPEELALLAISDEVESGGMTREWRDNISKGCRGTRKRHKGKPSAPSLIMDLLRKDGSWMRLSDIQKCVDRDPAVIRAALNRLTKSGELSRVGCATYRIPVSGG